MIKLPEKADLMLCHLPSPTASIPRSNPEEVRDPWYGVEYKINVRHIQ